MNVIEVSLRKFDSFQQRHKITSFTYGVIKKYSDDNGGNLSELLTYTMFVTVFPLLLLLITVLTLILASDPSAKKAVLDSTFSQFPVVGSQLGNNLHALRRGSIFGLVIGILGLVYGSTSLAGTGIYTMEQVWNIQSAHRPNYLKRLGRGLLFLIVLGVGVIITTILSGFGTFGRHNIYLGLLAELLAVIANIALYLAAFRALTPKSVNSKDLIPGAVFGAVAWTILQALAGYIVGHYLRNDNATYGVFGAVLGLIAWLYLGAEITVYAAEVNNVVKRHLWPRTLIQPPLTKADQVSITLQATENRRRPEQHVETKVMGKPTTQEEYLARDGKIDKDSIGTVRRVPKDK